jgi:hypothetical protein
MLCWLIGAKERPDGTPTTGDDVNVCSSYATCDLLDRIPPNAPLDMDEWCLVIHLSTRKLARTHVVQKIVALRQQMQGTASTMSMFVRTNFHAHR